MSTSDFDRHIPADHISISPADGDLMNGFTEAFNLSNAKSFSDSKLQQASMHRNRRLDLPADVGSGWFQHMVLRPGLEVTAMDISFKYPILMSSLQDPTLIELGFWQNGHDIRYRYEFAEGKMEPGQAVLATMPKAFHAEAFLPANCRMSGVRLSLDHGMLKQWLNDSRLPDNFSQSFFDNRSEYASYQQHIPTMLTQPLTQLRNRIWQGDMLRLYTEAKMMEIVALFMGQIEEHPKQQQLSLTKDDIDRLHQAKALLLARLENPPSLMELARAVHLNDHKLKVGFKAIFGTTVFGMLYEQRMQLAHNLLQERRFNVAEVALQVGYSNPSAFSAAFKRQYGVSPRDIRL